MLPLLVILIGLVVLFLLFFSVIGFFSFGWYITNRSGNSGLSLVSASTLSFSAVQHLHEFLDRQDSHINPSFTLESASVCRQTGKVFPMTVNRFGVMKYKETWYIKHFSKAVVPWNRLSDPEKRLIEGHILQKGLMVTDLLTSLVNFKEKSFISWKRVPGTNLQYMIVEQL